MASWRGIAICHTEMLSCSAAVFTWFLGHAWELKCLYKIGMSVLLKTLTLCIYLWQLLFACQWFWLCWGCHQCRKIGKERISNIAVKASMICRPWLCSYISITNRILPCCLLYLSLAAECPGMPCCAFFSLPSEIGCWTLQPTAHC